MKRIFSVLGCVMGISALLPAASVPVPVLLELFTSEGCSSCPPAELLLEELDAQQSVAGANLIVLSEHVDYWDRLGWRDPFSSAAFSARQNDYASRIDTSDVYTPELVVDGTWGVLGSSRSEIEKTIRKSVARPKQPVQINARQVGDMVSLQVQVWEMSGAHKQRIVYAVLARNRVMSYVKRGENARRTLEHVAVAYEITKVGVVPRGGALTKSIELKLPPQSAGSGTRAVVFVQEVGSGHITGVAETML